MTSVIPGSNHSNSSQLSIFAICNESEVAESLITYINTVYKWQRCRINNCEIGEYHILNDEETVHTKHPEMGVQVWSASSSTESLLSDPDFLWYLEVNWSSNVDLWRLTSVTQLQESLGRKLSLRVDAQQGIPSSMTLGTTEPHCSFSAPMASIRNRYQYLDHTTSVFNGVADVQLKGRHVKAKPFQSTKAFRHSCMEAKSNTFLVRTR